METGLHLAGDQLPATFFAARAATHGPSRRWRSPELAAGCSGSSAATVALGPQGATYVWDFRARGNYTRTAEEGPRLRWPRRARTSPVARAGVVGASEMARGAKHQRRGVGPGRYGGIDRIGRRRRRHHRFTPSDLAGSRRRQLTPPEGRKPGERPPAPRPNNGRAI
jgi:hypothetical protein